MKLPINALREFQAGMSVSCCFFLSVSNIKKRSKPIIYSLKKLAGKNSPDAKFGVSLKRALMMMPLLPRDLIGVELLDMFVWRWKRSFPAHQSAFDDLGDHLVRTYIRPNATFPKDLWCVCGRVTRTNNAEESSHASLNASVRVCGEVSLEMLFFAVEKQMSNTSREIDAGCMSHSKAIYARRNQLVANESSELFNGTQGVFKYLDHCSNVMYVKNLADVDNYLNRKRVEAVDLLDEAWAMRNRQVVIHSAVTLYTQLNPSLPKPLFQILATVSTWTFQPERCEVDVNGLCEEDLSVVRVEANQSFLLIRNVHEGGVPTDDSDTTEEEMVVLQGDQTRRVACCVFHGESYMLEIRK